MARNQTASRSLAGPLAVVLVAGVMALGPPAGAEPACGGPSEAPGIEDRARPGVIPDITCMDLQLAQDKLQAAGFEDIRERDASGTDRNQFADRNWVVVGQDPPAGSRRPADTTVRIDALRYGDPGAPPEPDRSRPEPVPDLMCFDLQEAEDTLQSAGFRNVASEDATGYGRRQVMDRNWTVVEQRPSAGKILDKGDRILLGAVKDEEESPC